MTSIIDRIAEIAADDDLTLTQRHQRIYAISPAAADMFARTNDAPLAREMREQQAADQRKQADAEASARARQPELTKRWQQMRQTDPVGASIFFTMNAAQIEREQQETAASDDGPEAA